MARRELIDYFGSLYMLGADVRLNEPLKWHTTIRIGGPASVFVSPYSCESLSETIGFLRSEKIPYRIIGGGSNVVCPDRYEGVVVSTRNLNLVKSSGERVLVEAGASVNSLLWHCLSKELTGMEFLAGLPGSIGGAVLMNAGAFGGEIGERVTKILYLDDKSRLIEIDGKSAGFSYRNSIFRSGGGIVLGAEFSLESGEKSEIRRKMTEILGKRLEKQPLEEPSAGSVFMRPRPDFYVGSTIERLGLKSLRVGGAEVSAKHAGFIVNKQSASQSDVVTLVEIVKKRVRESTGVDLRTEIEIWKEVE
ncbi:MAG: UDP-N-acetylmuramate dehydrogenase [Mesotoga sp.]|uniref:UDP-N-acetylmuramate dehydrogenase n=1 Tax=Mesotoga sp. TaxID=2053577 RepID=UPI00356562C1|nr:UDP-N-acetylmuramate dehydrogenase [Thermotogota bacterium]